MIARIVDAVPIVISRTEKPIRKYSTARSQTCNLRPINAEARMKKIAGIRKLKGALGSGASECQR